MNKTRAKFVPGDLIVLKKAFIGIKIFRDLSLDCLLVITRRQDNILLYAEFYELLTCAGRLYKYDTMLIDSRYRSASNRRKPREPNSKC
jgi:hypothetical protein